MVDLFLCHNGADKDHARRVGAAVEGTAWNGVNLSVFLDEWDIAPGENLIVRLNDALDKARYVAVFLSPEMISSEWCTAEVASVLATDPTNRAGRLLPIRVRDAHLTKPDERLNIPPFMRALVRLDFSTPERQKADLPKLLAHLRGERPPRGPGRGPASAPVSGLAPTLPESADLPDEVPEDLIGNIVPVREFPSTVWTARTALRSLHELPQGMSFPALILRENLLLSFHHPSTSPLRDICDVTSARANTTRDWRSDAGRWRWMIELLNRELRAYLWKHGVRNDGRRFFFGPQGAGPVKLRWGPGTARTVVRPPDPGKAGYWIHQGARLRFETLGSALYLSIDPLWVFTTDGRHQVTGPTAGPLAMKWGGRERNGTILRHVLMWCDVLAQGRQVAEIACGEQRIVIGRLPGGVRSPVGVIGDHVRIGALLEFTKKEETLDAGPTAPFSLTTAVARVEEDDDGETDLPF